MTPILRFAPSPTGPLHLGSARTAALNWLAARQMGGRFLLRIEDTDTERGTAAFEQDIVENLAWLGLTFDDAPPTPGFRQSENLPLYDKALLELARAGRAYGCDCSPDRLELVKKRQLSTGHPPRYDGHCRDRGLPLEPPNVVRFGLLADEDAAWEDLIKGHQHIPRQGLGDFVLRTSHGRVLFDLAGVVDDAAMAITHVLRGEDHLTNTARHHLVQRALGVASPAYGHLPLLKDASGAKLSKRALEGLGLGALRQQGYLSQAVLLYALDLGEGLIRDEQLAAIFSEEGHLLPEQLPPWKHLARGGGRVDLQHLDHFQRRLVGHLTENALLAQARNFEGVGAWIQDWPVARVREFWLGAPLLKDFAVQLAHLRQGGEWQAEWPEALRPALSVLVTQEAAWSGEESFKAALKQAAAEQGLKPAQMFHGLRHLLAGMAGGPGLWLIVQTLGVAEARARLKKAIG